MLRFFICSILQILTVTLHCSQTNSLARYQDRSIFLSQAREDALNGFCAESGQSRTNLDQLTADCQVAMEQAAQNKDYSYLELLPDSWGKFTRCLLSAFSGPGIHVKRERQDELSEFFESVPEAFRLETLELLVEFEGNRVCLKPQFFAITKEHERAVKVLSQLWGEKKRFEAEYRKNWSDSVVQEHYARICAEYERVKADPVLITATTFQRSLAVIIAQLYKKGCISQMLGLQNLYDRFCEQEKLAHQEAVQNTWNRMKMLALMAAYEDATPEDRIILRHWSNDPEFAAYAASVDQEWLKGKIQGLPEDHPWLQPIKNTPSLDDQLIHFPGIDPCSAMALCALRHQDAIDRRPLLAKKSHVQPELRSTLQSPKTKKSVSPKTPKTAKSISKKRDRD